MSPVIISKSIELRGSQRVKYYCMSGGPMNTRLSLVAMMLSGGPEGVEFKVGLNGCGAFEVLNAHLDMIGKGSCVNMLEV